MYRFLESGVALKVKVTDKNANLKVQKSETKGVPNSISELLYLSESSKGISNPVVEIEV